jgi:hypothetical protein
MVDELPILNLATATYQCTFGSSCDGICCREGRPLIYPDEIERIDAELDRFLPLLRPAASGAIARRGYLTKRRRLGERMIRNADGWCVFFNQGCVLHRVGEAEGDKFRYKPAVCALFPIQQDENDRWYVRQHGYKRERWDLFCLDPKNTTVRAAESLSAEIALAALFDAQARAAAAVPPAQSDAAISR